MSDTNEVPYCKHNIRVFEDCPECENEAEIALQSQTAEYVMKLKRQLAEANDTAAVTYGQLLSARETIQGLDARIARLQAVARNLQASVHYGIAKPHCGADAGRYLTEAIAALDQCNTHNDLETQAQAEKGTP